MQFQAVLELLGVTGCCMVIGDHCVLFWSSYLFVSLTSSTAYLIFSILDSPTPCVFLCVCVFHSLIANLSLYFVWASQASLCDFLMFIVPVIAGPALFIWTFSFCGFIFSPAFCGIHLPGCCCNWLFTCLGCLILLSEWFSFLFVDITVFTTRHLNGAILMAYHLGY